METLRYMTELKKGKLFKLLESNASEDQLREYINMNGKMKPFCPFIFRKIKDTVNQNIEQENGNE